MAEPGSLEDRIREDDRRRRDENQMREIRRRALDAIRRLAPQDTIPSASPEYTPGIYFEDIDILLARRQKNRNRKAQGGGGFA